MMRYVALLNFTDQGLRGIHQTIDRARAFRLTVEKYRASLKDLYWTSGQYDLIAIIEVPDEETGMALLLSLSVLGNVRSQTLRAFSSEEMGAILNKMS
jgi:uncharacterized protein with GYD domain